MNKPIETRKQTALIVLGMHRSGTSALTGCLKILGADLGSKLVDADERYNPKGHWEDMATNNLNDRILDVLESGWQDERPLPKKWLQNEAVTTLAAEISVILNTFSNTSLWALKDPRLSRLLPLWINDIKSIANPIFIICVRHPNAVAESLAKRDGISKTRGYLIWLRYMLEAEYNTRHEHRIIINYDDLLQNWHAALDPILSALPSHITLTQEKDRLLSDFISLSLQHHLASTENEPNEVSLLAESVFEIYNATYINQSLCFLDDVQKKIALLIASFEIHISQIIYFSNELLKNKVLLSEQKKQNGFLISDINHLTLTHEKQKIIFQKEIARIKSTISWKITKPLRAIWNFLNGLKRSGRE